ncbi:MAG TPA: VCBS repeat-containing protein, partial [bacterium]|nr:VCBS repeat-containing protein [bacterium]
MKRIFLLCILLFSFNVVVFAGSWTNAAEPMGANQGVRYGYIAWGDYDNDGDLDIAVSGDDGVNKRFIIYRNNGAGTFTNAAELMGANQGLREGSIVWGDYDNDGDPDIAVSGYDGGLNPRFIIYRNDGDSTFTQVAEPMGANEGVLRSSIAWGDYDNDGDLDIAVSGDTSSTLTNKRFIIYRNNGDGTFTQVAEPMGANQGVSNSSIAWGDYDNDGDLDIAVSGDYDGSANNRFIIYRNNGDGTFTQAAEPMGANQGVWHSSIAWGDYDNDGDLDIAVSGLAGVNKRFIIYRNNGDGTFTNAAEPMGANQGVYYSSIAWA